MKVEMLATAASPDGILHAGQVYDLPRKKAQAYLQRGPTGRPYARLPVDSRKPTKVSRASEEEETDEVEDTEES